MSTNISLAPLLEPHYSHCTEFQVESSVILEAGEEKKEIGLEAWTSWSPTYIAAVETQSEAGPYSGSAREFWGWLDDNSPMSSIFNLLENIHKFDY